MDFEDCKAAWQKHQREEYLLHPLTSAIIADIEAEAERLRRTQLLRDSMGIGLFLATVLAFAGVIVVESSRIARAGTALVMIGFVGEFLYAARATWLERHKRLDLPLKLALAKERKQVLAGVRLLWVRLALYAIPIIGGLVRLQFAQRNIESGFLGFIMGGCFFVCAGIIKRLLKARREVGAVLEGIDKDLADIAEIESET